MKSFSNAIAVILILLGTVGLAYQGFSYKTQEEVIKIGDLKVTSEREKNISIPPVASGIALALGIGLFVLNRYRK